LKRDGSVIMEDLVRCVRELRKGSYMDACLLEIGIGTKKGTVATNTIIELFPPPKQQVLWLCLLALHSSSKQHVRLSNIGIAPLQIRKTHHQKHG